MKAFRQLVIVADDFGLGPEVSRGILELAQAGRVTGTVLLVNSPHAAEAVRDWESAGCPVRLGWHVCLTLDRPVLPTGQVRSLVQPDGTFLELRTFLGRLLAGRISADEVRAELQAQLDRFRELTGQGPALINGHHHVHVFPLVARVLQEVLQRTWFRPHIRRVRETASTLWAEPRARGKRLFLGAFGRRAAARLDHLGYPGNQGFAGITDPRGLAWPDERQAGQALGRWLAATPGPVVELMCHPGRFDEAARRCDGPASLVDRCPGLAVRCGPDVREREQAFLKGPEFPRLLEQLELVPVAPLQGSHP